MRFRDLVISPGSYLHWNVPVSLGYAVGPMPKRGRHQSTSSETRRMLHAIEAIDGVVGVIIGRSYGGKSLGRGGRTGAVKLQGKKPGGLKAVTQSARGLQEIFILTRSGDEERIASAIEKL